MDPITQSKLEKYFEHNSEMEVDIVKNGVFHERKFYSDIYEILSDYDDNGEYVMYFPI